MIGSDPDLTAFIGLHTSQAILAGVLAGAHLLLFRKNRSQFLSFWAAGWCGLGGTHLLTAIEAAIGSPPAGPTQPPALLAFATDWLGFLAIAALFAGALTFIDGKDRSRRSLLTLGATAGLFAAATALLLPSLEGAVFWRYPARTTLAGSAAIASAVWLWRASAKGTAAKSVAAAIGCYSLPMFAYAVVIARANQVGPKPTLDRLAIVGYLEAVLMVVMALSLIVWLLERERAATAAAILSEQDLRKQLEARESVFRSVIDQVPDAITVLDVEGRYVLDLRPGRSFLGYNTAELLGRSMFELVHDDDLERTRAAFAAIAREPGTSGVAQIRLRHRDGRLLTLECTGTNCRSVPSLQGILVLARDVTERRSFEQRLAQAERLESIGRLAGGIAHDFNNLLTVVRGNASFLATELPPESPAGTWIAEIQQAADRGASLTQHLLAFSRKQPVEPRVFELNGLITGLLPIVRRLVGERVAVSWRPAGRDCQVKADPNRIEQMVLNLVANARDAMPNGGRLVLAAKRHPAGSVRLLVEDTGIGMTEEARRRAFEPFFTTKPPGAGAGLGLATSYGIVEQAGGSVTLASEVGRGTTVTVSLPEMAGVPVEPDPTRPLTPLPPPDPPTRGTRVILVAEDEASVRTVAATALRNAGFHVIEARDGVEAFERLTTTPEVACVVTDVVMPRLSGDGLARRIWEVAPNLPVLFMSGYTDEFRPAALQRDHLAGFLQKPYSARELTDAVRALLEPRGAVAETRLLDPPGPAPNGGTWTAAPWGVSFTGPAPPPAPATDRSDTASRER